MQNTQEEATSNAPKRTKKWKPREIKVGHVVTVRYQRCDGTWDEPKKFKLAAKTDLSANPPELGPETPLHRTLLGHYRHHIVSVPRKVRVENFRRA